VLQALNLMELQDSPGWREDGEERARGVAEALRIAHRSRATDPVEDLVNYGDAVADRISKETVRRLWEARGEPAEGAEAAVPERARDATRGETTHFTVVDGDGLMVAATASVNAYFGARVAHPELGFLYNDYMNEFVVGDPDHPFALGPDAMPYSSMSPTIVSRGGAPVLGLGSPGSARIVSAVAQVVDRWVAVGQTLEEAVAAPRLHVVPEADLYLEGVAGGAAPPWAVDSGFEIVVPADDLAAGGRNPYFGGVHAVARQGDGWVGAADPRRDGAVR
jgi:gamma-glutamyltranspeptidase/glutathione hydrolase